ncbi:ATP-binding protein [Streptomyces roseus]|uniref:Histidine kinase/HSP90-like ATPase domain-containing protein n=1 Tax=Streptomyces roseus TaxID=66430 RepID=A0A0J7A864_9ACTN|nr:ATP-binding protein [Streptomyces roseus]KMO93471.1 hypothetical protein ACS04_34890 [Streptomyces roseus]
MEDATLPPLLPAEPLGAGLSCAQARETARASLAGVDLPAAGVDDVLTVVTEMISNARRHGGGATAFQVTARSGIVTVEVRDRSTVPPRIKPWAPNEPGGFGWRLVNQLATTDVRIHNDGKTVTATLNAAQTGRP